MCSYFDFYLIMIIDFFQITKQMEGVTKALDKAMSSMDLEKVSDTSSK